MRPGLLLAAGLIILAEAFDSKGKLEEADEKNPLLAPFKHMRAINIGVAVFIVLYSAYHVVMGYIR